MAKLAKFLQGVAGAGGGAGENIEDLFSTYLYEGNGTGKAIENGINLGQSYGSGSIRLNEGHINLSSTSVITGDFTIETWAFIEDLPWTYGCFIGSTIASGYNFQFSVDPSNRLRMYNNSIEILGSTASNQVPLGQWTHLAVTRSSGTHRFFVDGILKGSSTAGSTTTYRFDQIGAVLDSYYVMQGYMSGARIVNGTALYTSNFTPPTSELTAVTNTDFLFGQGDTPLVDQSSNSVSISNFGTTASTFGPFDAAEAGEGGLVWIKNRTLATWNILTDTERGTEKVLHTNETDAQANRSDTLISFNASGFTLGAGGTGNANSVNATSSDYASWTFRKAPKFFDVVTYTGTGSLTSISHNLGATPACIMVKRTDNTSRWLVWHKDLPLHPLSNTNNHAALFLDGTDAVDYFNSYWGGPTEASRTSTSFTVGASGSGDYATNISGASYVAYLFAHNDGDGGFGPDGDADIIKCGSYTGNGGYVDINLGWEPQWVLVKKATGTGNWTILDNMRGWVNSGGFVTSDQQLYPNLSDAETAYELGHPTATGWQEQANTTSGETYIYIAIRRGPMAVPENASDVFAIDTTGSTGDGKAPHLRASFPVDMSIRKRLSGGETAYNVARLISGKALSPDSTAAELSIANFDFDYMNGWGNYTNTNSDYYGWMWKRAPGFFDAVAFDFSSGDYPWVDHNLGVVPEMIWMKCRNESSTDWIVMPNVSPYDYRYRLYLNSTSAIQGPSTNYWANTAPTATQFRVDRSFAGGSSVPSTSATMVAYLFASLDGISKVGSVNFTYGTNLNVDCGFSSGARFVLIKRVDGTSGWSVMDTERGIVSGQDPYLQLDNTNAEANYDVVDPYSSGFTMADIGWPTGTYIFYAIA